MTLTSLLQFIEKNKPLDFEDIFSRSFDLYQKVWVKGLLLQLLGILISYGLFFIMYIPMIGSSFIIVSLEENESSSSGFVMVVFMILIFLLYMAVILGLAIFHTGLQMAFYRIVRLKERGERQEGVNFGMFFKRPLLKKTIYFGLAQFGIAMIAVLLCVIPILYVIIPLQFAMIIYAFNTELTIKDLYKTAFRLGNKKWGIAFGLLIISGFLAMIVGFIACGIGIYITMSFVYMPTYLIYKDVVGFDEDENAIATIGEYHL